MLNYGYAVLKGYVDSTIISFGLDPYLGLLHTPRAGRESLSLDLMEPFRTVVDEVVYSSIAGGTVKPSDFKDNLDGVSLDGNAKEEIIKGIAISMLHHRKQFLDLCDLIENIINDMKETDKTHPS